MDNIRLQKVTSLPLKHECYTNRFNIDSIIGSHNTLKKVQNQAAAAGKNRVPVLLQGESGTGKELFAQLIHHLSRLEGPFIPVNCGAIPRNLAESELFGYEGGAFTGADRKGRPGKIELADEGTLFLDEIGDMSLSIQPALLRVIEEKQFMRIGGSRYIPVNFRVIAASNRDLLSMVDEKRFRADLYYRLSAFKISLPPLRERGEDIRKLSLYFLDKACKEMRINLLEISEDAWNSIMNFNWPGNIRQLENAIVYAASMAQNGIITPDDLPREVVNPVTKKQRNFGLLTLQESEAQTIKKVIDFTGGNVSEAAHILDISRSTLYRKLRELQIDTM